jgi:endonuclease/exonuclease/phosphatase (EEP) superfamily protein YafD
MSAFIDRSSCKTARLYNRDRRALQARGRTTKDTISPSLCRILTVLEQSPGSISDTAKDSTLELVRTSKQLISLLAGAVALAVIFGFLAPWLPLADSVAHFRLHLAVVAILAALAFGLWRDWWKAGFAGLVSFVGVVGMTPAVPLLYAPPSGGEESAVTLVQLNLSFRNRTPDAVAAFVRREGADIVTLQEVTARTGRVIDLLAKDYPHSIRCPFSPRVGGVAVLSRFPRAPGESQGCVEGKGLAWLRVMAGGRPVSVASLHLSWPFPFDQAGHINEIEAPLRDIPRPVILAGDFNAAPWSHAVNRVEEATDATIARGLRFSFHIRVTRWTPPVPMPIDHVLLPAQLQPTEIRVTRGPGSDHRSVVAKLAFPDDGETKQVLAPAPPAPSRSN